jgi:hypothetical protein
MICQSCNQQMIQHAEKRWICPHCFAGSHPDRVITQGTWTLQVFYRAKGSRSEGSHGVLYKDGLPIPDAVPGTGLETDLGLMKYYKNPRDSHLPLILLAGIIWITARSSLPG